MTLETMTLEMLLDKCSAHARLQTYCWFRISFAKIGAINPSWVAWFEELGYAENIDHTQGPATLREALEKLIRIYKL